MGISIAKAIQVQQVSNTSCPSLLSPLPLLIRISVSQALTSAATCLTLIITLIVSRLGMENSLAVFKVRRACSFHTDVNFLDD